MKSISAIIPALVFLFCISGAARAGGYVGLWETYKASFLSADGRIMDRGLGGISHSEGQGYAMLLSVAYSDRQSFDLIWRWTGDNLRVRPDGLMAWSWGQRPNGKWETIDLNNATDGDVLIAYALIRASERWPDGSYADDAVRIIKAVREKLAVSVNGRTYLLPGYYGFSENGGAVVLNPSYVIFPAYRAFARYDDKEFWTKAADDGKFLLKSSCLGNPCLPLDWVSVNQGRVSAREGKVGSFGADAVRIFLHISKEAGAEYPAGLMKMLGLYEERGFIPAWADPESGAVSEGRAPAGFYAVYSFVAKKSGDDAISKKLASEAEEMLKAEKDDYYSFSLYLLSVTEGAL